jgi:uncharacterized membrane protein
MVFNGSVARLGQAAGKRALYPIGGRISAASGIDPGIKPCNIGVPKRIISLLHSRSSPNLSGLRLMAIAITLHILAAVIWVGGMFFAYMALRPVAASLLEPPLRLPLWSRTFARFFPWVWAAVVLLPVTGYWMVFYVFEGFGNVGLHVDLMHVLGWAMIAIFLHVYFAPYQRLARAVDKSDWPEGGKQLAQIRRLVGINLILGLVLVVIATGGAYFSAFLQALSE